MNRRTSIAAVGVATVAIGGGCLLAIPASATSTTHTLTFTAVTKSQASLGKHGGVSTDHDISNGKLIGYDVLSFGSGNSANVAVALSHGVLYAHVTFSKKGALKGTVTGGAGRYAGATGSVVGQAIAKKKTSVTVTYSL